jgi:hypothetical protein
MKQKLPLLSLLSLMAVALGLHLIPISVVRAQGAVDWAQWGRTAQHSGATPAVGQSPNTQLADITFDPFVTQEQAESGDLLAHYQAPLVDGSSVFTEFKTGMYISCNPPGSGHPFPCGPDDWNAETWNERAFVWQGTSLLESWNFQSDWKPEPNGALGDGNPSSTRLSAEALYTCRDSPGRFTS